MLVDQMFTTPSLVPRPVASSVEELLAGATGRQPFATTDSKSGAPFERVLIDGEPHVVKYLHVDDDWIMRATGDVRCRPLLVWRSGLLDVVPPGIDHAVVGAAEGLGRNGWGAALLMRDVSPYLVPPGDDPVPLEQHLTFLDHMAALAARFWGFTDTIGLTPFHSRWTWFCDGMLAAEAERGWPDGVPPIVARGWGRFDDTAPRDVVEAVEALRHDTGPLVEALSATPMTLLHGDWKYGNLGTAPDGRTVLLDWAGPGAGPIGCDLAWYMAINVARMPQTKEEAIDSLHAALERHGVDTTAWWDAQIRLCLLGALVLFGWEKALGGPDEFGWWCDRAREGTARL
jgi:Phosphotransferase enzyme family